MAERNGLESISYSCTNYFFKDYDQEEKDILAFGLMALISTMTSLLLIIIISSLIGVTRLAVTAAIVAAILRLFSGGIHAKTYKQCIVTSTTVFTSLGLIASLNILEIESNAFLIFSIFMIIGFIIIYLYAPADVESNPINSEMRRMKLKRESLIIFLLIILVSYIYIVLKEGSNQLITAVLLGLAWQLFTLTPVAYYLLELVYKKRRDTDED